MEELPGGIDASIQESLLSCGLKNDSTKNGYCGNHTQWKKFFNKKGAELKTGELNFLNFLHNLDCYEQCIVHRNGAFTLPMETILHCLKGIDNSLCSHTIQTSKTKLNKTLEDLSGELLYLQHDEIIDLMVKSGYDGGLPSSYEYTIKIFLMLYGQDGNKGVPRELKSILEKWVQEKRYRRYRVINIIEKLFPKSTLEWKQKAIKIIQESIPPEYSRVMETQQSRVNVWRIDAIVGMTQKEAKKYVRDTLIKHFQERLKGR